MMREGPTKPYSHPLSGLSENYGPRPRLIIILSLSFSLFVYLSSVHLSVCLSVCCVGVGVDPRTDRHAAGG